MLAGCGSGDDDSGPIAFTGIAPDGGERRVYVVDPGDMRTQMQQEAFPGEDISDRPPPEESVPGLLALIEGEAPSGLYRARDVVGASGVGLRYVTASALIFPLCTKAGSDGAAGQ